MDISPDFNEHGRTLVAVICPGVKSILDIPKTVQYMVPNSFYVCITKIVGHSLSIITYIYYFYLEWET